MKGCDEVPRNPRERSVEKTVSEGAEKQDKGIDAVTPEQKARQKIEQQLVQCGWTVQNYREMNISAGLGVAIREFPLKTGFAD